MDIQSTELNILASLLGNPDMDAKEAVRDLADHYEWLAPAVEELDKLSLEEWQAEHARLFITGYPTTPCPPFESAYLQGRMRGHAVDALVDLYHRIGMASTGAPADYLGTLLECAAYLKSEPKAASIFWSELWSGHLGRWAPKFCRDLKRHARLKLYRIVAERLCLLFPEMRLALSAVA
jgi:TorA maturation chaperone TorD